MTSQNDTDRVCNIRRQFQSATGCCMVRATANNIHVSMRVRLPGGMQMNVPAIYYNALPPNITPSSSIFF